MAYSSLDPTTGAPVFLSGDAPDPGVNESQVADFAAEVGTRLIGPTADRTAYAYAREGLEWYDTTLDAVYVHNGSGWALWHKAWSVYTPVLSNVSGGPTVTARYAVASGVVRVKIAILLNGANFGTAPLFSLPVTAVAPVGFEAAGQALYGDTSAGVVYVGSVHMNNTTTVAPVTWSGSPVQANFNVSASLPFVWASGDRLNVDFTYEAA